MRVLVENAVQALLADPGVGKTSIVYGAIKVLKRVGEFRKALVVAPKNVLNLVWPAERDKWSDFEDIRVERLHGPKKDEALARDADVYLITPEGLEWLLKPVKSRSPVKKRLSVVVDVAAFRALGFCTLVIDELTRFKSMMSARSKTLHAVHRTFHRRWGLTGSIVPNGLIDLFPQIYALDEGRTFGKFITYYRAVYFDANPYTGDYALKPGAADLIYKRLAPIAHRISDAHLDLPEIVHNVIRVELPAAVRAVYDDLETDLFAAIDDKEIVAANAAAASSKCRQVASGGAYLTPELDPTGKLLKSFKDRTREWIHLHDEKTDALELLVESLNGGQVFVAYEFRHSLARIVKRFSAKRFLLDGELPTIGGGTTPKRAARIAAAWNAGDIQILPAHPQSAAHGLNLQGSSCQHVAFYDGTWDLELYDQFIRRVRRQGSKAKRVFVHSIAADVPVEYAIAAAVRRKDVGQRALYAALAEMSKGHGRRRGRMGFRSQ